MDNAKKKIDIDNIIYEAVQKAIEVGRKIERLQSKKKGNPYFEDAERRLRAYPDLKIKAERITRDIEDLKKEIVEYKKLGEIQDRSKDIVFLTPHGGEKISLIERKEALILDKELDLKQTQREIREIEEIIEILSWQDRKRTIPEPWIKTITLKYFEGMKDDDIAERLHCDKTTIWRNRGRIMNRLLTLWYGIEAVRQVQ